MDKLTDILNHLGEIETQRYTYITDTVENCIWVTEYNMHDEALQRFRLDIKMKEVPLEQ